MAEILGYEVKVVDDRSSFANPTLINMADRSSCDDFERALDGININPQTFVVIITRGLYTDKVCLRNVITKPARYIGMMGSYRKVKAFKGELSRR